MPVETLSYVYTSESEIKRLASNEGVNLRLADLIGDTKDEYWDDLISDATDIINQYVLNFYEEVDLAGNRWVRNRASWIALAHLSRRKMNSVPDGVQTRYDEIIAELIEIRQGIMQIPRLPTRHNLLPTLSNQRIDDRYLTRKLRVNPNNSVGSVTGDQDLDYFWTYDWF